MIGTRNDWQKTSASAYKAPIRFLSATSNVVIAGALGEFKDYFIFDVEPDTSNNMNQYHEQ